MAKKKSATAASSESKSTAKAAKPAATKTTNKSETAKSESKISTNGDASSASAILGSHQIGETAGALWLYLSDKGESSLTTIKKDIHTSNELLLAAVGWLAREEKLDFQVSGKTLKISLK